MSKIADKLHQLLHNLVVKFEGADHPAAAELRAIHTRLDGDARQLASGAATDARHVEADAEHAAGPVVAEATHDAEHLATEAAADATTTVEQAVQPPAATTA
jgi:hypothetical protein